MHVYVTKDGGIENLCQDSDIYQKLSNTCEVCVFSVSYGSKQVGVEKDVFMKAAILYGITVQIY